MDNQYTKLRAIDVSKYVEKKSNLSYLSWAWAADQLLQNDPMATWEYKEPKMFGQTMMVFCSVTAFGKTMTAQLPVMDHKNKAIPNPDAFDVNKAMMRCLAKAIALHGIGLYIYAGDDLPDAPPPPPEPEGLTESARADYLATIEDASTLEALKAAYTKAKKAAEQSNDRDAYKEFTTATGKRKAKLEEELVGAYGEQA
jgi:hypothetical protein